MKTDKFKPVKSQHDAGFKLKSALRAYAGGGSVTGGAGYFFNGNTGGKEMPFSPAEQRRTSPGLPPQPGQHMHAMADGGGLMGAIRGLRTRGSVVSQATDAAERGDDPENAHRAVLEDRAEHPQPAQPDNSQFFYPHGSTPAPRPAGPPPAMLQRARAQLGQADGGMAPDFYPVPHGSLRTDVAEYQATHGGADPMHQPQPPAPVDNSAFFYPHSGMQQPQQPQPAQAAPSLLDRARRVVGLRDGGYAMRENVRPSLPMNDRAAATLGLHWDDTDGDEGWPTQVRTTGLHFTDEGGEGSVDGYAHGGRVNDVYADSGRYLAEGGMISRRNMGGVVYGVGDVGMARGGQVGIPAPVATNPEHVYPGHTDHGVPRGRQWGGGPWGEHSGAAMADGGGVALGMITPAARGLRRGGRVERQYQSLDTEMGGVGAADGGRMMACPHCGGPHPGAMCDGGMMAGGGEVRGPGGPREDKVPAIDPSGQPMRLSDGEYVLPAKTVQKLGGPEQLDQVVRQTNDGREPGAKPMPGGKPGAHDGTNADDIEETIPRPNYRDVKNMSPKELDHEWQQHEYNSHVYGTGDHQRQREIEDEMGARNAPAGGDGTKRMSQMTRPLLTDQSAPSTATEDAVITGERPTENKSRDYMQIAKDTGKKVMTASKRGLRTAGDMAQRGVAAAKPYVQQAGKEVYNASPAIAQKGMDAVGRGASAAADAVAAPVKRVMNAGSGAPAEAPAAEAVAAPARGADYVVGQNGTARIGPGQTYPVARYTAPDVIDMPPRGAPVAAPPAAAAAPVQAGASGAAAAAPAEGAAAKAAGVGLRGMGKTVMKGSVLPLLGEALDSDQRHFFSDPNVSVGDKLKQAGKVGLRVGGGALGGLGGSLVGSPFIGGVVGSTAGYGLGAAAGEALLGDPMHGYHYHDPSQPQQPTQQQAPQPPQQPAQPAQPGQITRVGNMYTNIDPGQAQAELAHMRSVDDYAGAPGNIPAPTFRDPRDAYPVPTAASPTAYAAGGVVRGRGLRGLAAGGPADDPQPDSSSITGTAQPAPLPGVTSDQALRASPAYDPTENARFGRQSALGAANAGQVPGVSPLRTPPAPLGTVNGRPVGAGNTNGYDLAGDNARRQAQQNAFDAAPITGSPSEHTDLQATFDARHAADSQATNNFSDWAMNHTGNPTAAARAQQTAAMEDQTRRRGQNIEAASTARGQDITARGQDIGFAGERYGADTQRGIAGGQQGVERRGQNTQYEIATQNNKFARAKAMLEIQGQNADRLNTGLEKAFTGPDGKVDHEAATMAARRISNAMAKAGYTHPGQLPLQAHAELIGRARDATNDDEAGKSLTNVLGNFVAGTPQHSISTDLSDQDVRGVADGPFNQQAVTGAGGLGRHAFTGEGFFGNTGSARKDRLDALQGRKNGGQVRKLGLRNGGRV